MTESTNRAGLTVRKIVQKMRLSPAEDTQHGINQLSIPSTSLALGTGGITPALARSSSARGTPQGTNKHSHIRDNSTSSSQSTVLSKRPVIPEPRKGILHLTGVSTSVATPFHHVRITEPNPSPPSTSSYTANDAGHAQDMNKASQSAIKKPPKPPLSIQTDTNDRLLHGEAARRGKNRVSEDDVEIPLSSSPVEEYSQASSIESQVSSATCPSRQRIHSVSYLPPNFDATVPALRPVREEKISDLTGCISMEDARPRYESALSDVWKGRLNGQQVVAIKSLRKQRIDLTRLTKRLQREAGTWWCFNHKNILQLLGLAWDDKFGGLPAIISPWCKNGNAHEYLERRKDSITFRERISLFRDVVEGLNYIHMFSVPFSLDDPRTVSDGDNIRLVHGDLKPTNVLVDEYRVAKLCDFGLIRLTRPNGTINMSTKSGHTGTPLYLSYELAEGDSSPTQASDIHALGCVGLEFICSLIPYPTLSNNQRTDYKITVEIRKGVPPAVRPTDTPGTVSKLWGIFEQCWSLKPEDRPEAETICGFLREHHERLTTDLGS